MKTDARLKQDVVDELKWDPAVDQTKIGVAVTEGAVTLSGHVSNYAEKVAAKAAARRVDGVHAIVDKVDVQVESRHRASDEGLAERISHVLTWNVSAPGKSIKAEVQNGIVTLTGEVDWHYQRANVLQNIEHVAGVIGVIDLVKIRPRASAGDVQGRIAAALERHADIEASRVAVTIANGTVTLNGEVESLAEMDRVERAAWAGPGVVKVIDNLRIAR